MRKTRFAGIIGKLVLTSTMFCCAMTGFAQDDVDEALAHPWSFSAALGWKDFEGDEEICDSMLLSLHASYDYSERWTFEGIFTLYPALDGSTRVEYSTGREINRLEERTGIKGTSGVGVSLECLYHLTRWDRVDPFFVVGGGVVVYEDKFDEDFDPTLNAGVGLMYHFNDEWALRVDARTFVAGISAIEANSLINVGVVWTLGAHVPADWIVEGGIDTDADGLSDKDELDVYGTDPHDPDTDGDELTDYEEVIEYGTNPLARDSDLDLLGDGEEVHVYGTNPLVADTDEGGVVDGHEVLEDGTDPLNGEDDLLMFTLNIEFDTDKSIIKPEYFGNLDVIGKVMSRYPLSTAKVEGHADRRKTSGADYNRKLSKSRAGAVAKYLENEWEIDSGRITFEGYGFDRPLGPNDPIAGNAANRRVEVYVEGAGGPVSVLPTAGKPERAVPEKGAVDDDIVPEKGAADIDQFVK